MGQCDIARSIGQSRVMPALRTATSLSVANPDALGDTVLACAPSDAQFDGSNLRSCAGAQGSF